MPERVAVTGMGVISGVGVGVEAFWASLLTGTSGVRTLTAFDPQGFPVRIACEVQDRDLDLSAIRPPKSRKLMNRSTLFATLAAAEARRQSKLAPDAVDPARLGVTFGAGGMGAVDLEFLQAEVRTLQACEREGGFTWSRFCDMYQKNVNPLAPIRALPNSAAAAVAIQQEARGPNATIATACSSGTHAIGSAAHSIRAGAADVMIAGGTDAMVNPTGLLGFFLLGTLSRRNDDPERASRPFERDRDGFVIGEGSAALILERESFARARGAEILGWVEGFASSCDAYRMTDGRPDGSGPASSMRAALADANRGTEEIGYINAHGTGTEMNDRAETRAVRSVFGESPPPMSSTKSMTGHLLAGAGAVECVATLMALRSQTLPPTINLEVPDPECDLDYVPNEAREARVSVAITNSFGFGGQNATLVVASAS